MKLVKKEPVKTEEKISKSEPHKYSRVVYESRGFQAIVHANQKDWQVDLLWNKDETGRVCGIIGHLFFRKENGPLKDQISRLVSALSKI